MSHPGQSLNRGHIYDLLIKNWGVVVSGTMGIMGIMGTMGTMGIMGIIDLKFPSFPTIPKLPCPQPS